jgi:hypothetical protein
MADLTTKTYLIPKQGLNACCQNEECETILILPAGNYSTANWLEQELLDSYPGVSLVSSVPLVLPDFPPEWYVLNDEVTVPHGRTREFLIGPGPMGSGIDLMYQTGNGPGGGHLKRGPGLFVTSDRAVQCALYNYPGVTQTRDWAT